MHLSSVHLSGEGCRLQSAGELLQVRHNCCKSSGHQYWWKVRQRGGGGDIDVAEQGHPES